MTDLDELIDAAGRSPGAGLLRVVMATARDATAPAPATAFLAGLDPVPYDEPTRAGVAEFLLWAAAPDAALAWTEAEPGALAVVRARVLVALGREAEAREAYTASLAVFPQLRDPALDAALAQARVHLVAGAETNVVPLERAARTVVVRDAAEAATDAESPRERVTLAEVGGLDEVKTQIRRRIVLPFERKGLFDRFKKRAGGGVLLYGPPGCGKTLIARATAAECGARFTAVEITDVLDKYIGESEKRVAALFADARARRPAVLFFDEVEALARRRRYGDNDHHASMVSTFLAEMDGFRADNAGVLVLAATNTPWAVDAAFRRPGRFDRSLFIPPPDRPARAAILAIALKERPVEPRVSLADIAERTSGFSGADLTHLVETACDFAIERSIASDAVVPISAADLKAALKEVKPTTAEWLTQARNHAKFANESGFYDDVAAFLDKNGR